MQIFQRNKKLWQRTNKTFFLANLTKELINKKIIALLQSTLKYRNTVHIAPICTSQMILTLVCRMAQIRIQLIFRTFLKLLFKFHNK